MKNSWASRFVVPLLALPLACAYGDISLSSGCAVLRLSEEAVPVSLKLKGDDAECLDLRRPEPFAEIQLSDGSWRAADRARKSGGTLEIGFRDTETTLRLTVENRPEWIGLRVAGFRGPRPSAVRFAALNTSLSQNVGARLCVGWTDAQALCVMATAPQAEAAVSGHPKVTLDETIAAVRHGEPGVLPQVRLTAAARDSSESKMEGAAAAIIACPTAAFKAAARGVACAYGLPVNESPAGAPAKELPAARESCLVVSAGAGDSARVIRLCADSGVRRVVLAADAWSTPSEPCAVNATRFPRGLADLRDFVGRLRAAGLAAGCAVQADALLSDDASKRLAEVYNTCGFDTLRLAGGGGRARAGCAAEAQERALRGLFRPVVFVAPELTQRTWHALARVSAAESYLDALGGAQRAGRGLTVQRYIDGAVAGLPGLREDMMPAEIGCVGIWARQKRGGQTAEGTQFDELEYALARSAAFDAPVALQIDVAEIDRNPLAPELLRLVKDYETARLAHRFTEAEQAPMRQPGQAFTMIHRAGFEPTLVAVSAVPVGADRDTRAMVGAFEGGSVATLWRAAGSAKVGLDVSPLKARASDFDDQRVVVLKSAADKLVLPVTTRRLTLRCPTLDAATLERALRSAQFSN
jgi:hypothetical protein